MIGLIGPRDSVRAIQDVATRTDFAGELVPRPYEDAAETSALARELSHFCQVILCTGRAPYALIADDPDVSSEVQYISHSGADLYHSIAQALIENGGTVPKVSVDTMEAADTIFAFTELGLPEPELVELSADGSGLDALAAQHRALLADGTVQAVMTCVSQVYADLAADDVRVWRISHTRPTLAEALSRAHLADQLVRSRSLELGVVLFEIDEAELRKLSSFERENTRLTVHQHLLKLAHKHSGRLNNLDERSFLMTVTRGVIEEAIQRAKDNQRSLLTEFGGEVRIHIGAGTGTSYSFAEANARQALEFTKQQSTPHVVFPGGQVVAATAQDDPGFQLQNTSGPVLDLASRLGIGPLSARRLMNALGRLGHEPITAQQLAHAYGVQARSARRLLASLCEAGLAAEVGLRAHPGAGRPQTVYEVDLSQIMVETD